MMRSSSSGPGAGVKGFAAIAGCSVAGLMAVLAFYVLSIGPMSMALGVKSVFAFHGIRSARISFAHEEFTGRGRMEEDSFALKFEYAPLLFVCERNEAARHLLFGYLHLWGVDAHEADEK